jgi:hypothetical protein
MDAPLLAAIHDDQHSILFALFEDENGLPGVFQEATTSQPARQFTRQEHGSTGSSSLILSATVKVHHVLWRSDASSSGE